MTEKTELSEARIFMHCGAGLAYYTSKKFEGAEKSALQGMLLDCIVRYAPQTNQCVTSVLPEVMKVEKTAAKEVLAEFFAIRYDKEQAFGLVSLSYEVFTAVLTALIELGYGKELTVCLHQDALSPEYTLHRLTADGGERLGDWPYGSLNAWLDEEDYEHIGFAIPR